MEDSPNNSDDIIVTDVQGQESVSEPIPEFIHSGSLGARLRAAREERRMSMQEVADRLYLERRMIEALENDDFAHMPPPTFIQGYVRCYAKLLELPAEPFVEAFREQMGESAPSLNYNVPRDIPEAEVSSRDPWFKTLTFLLIIGGIVMVVLWWNDVELPLDFSLPSSSSREVTKVDDGLPDIEINMEESLLSEDSMEAISLPPSLSGLQESGDYEPPAEEAGTAEDSSAASPAEDKPAPADNAIPARSSAASDAPIADAKADTLVIAASSDCWTEITALGGTKIFSGILKAGNQREFSGTPPFQVKLGRAEGVAITYEGKPVDLSGRSGITRLTLPRP
jgi:cytoskeleton protein RodZ